MGFEKVIGQNHLKAHLKKSVENKRIPHAQLFVGDSGTGALPMAIAYAQEILSSSFDDGSDAHNACLKKVNALMHPDLHFVYPINTNDVVKKHPLSSNFLKDWRSFVSNNPYGTLYQWLETLGIEKKQGNINVDEAKEMMKALSLKAYDGGYKIMIVWMADRMNTACANKILKLVEEPPDKTVLLLITEHEEHILETIKSRCQKLQFPKLSEQQIKSQLVDLKGVNEARATSLSKQAHGDFNKALTLLTEDGDDLIFEKWFISWMRTAFKAKGNKSAINNLITWSEEIAGQGRETQKKFLAYCTETFRQALLKNYNAQSLLFFKANDANFTLEKFAPFIHQNNIFDLTESLDEASYHIGRNGNAKIIFTDLSIKMTRLIHKKE